MASFDLVADGAVLRQFFFAYENFLHAWHVATTGISNHMTGHKAFKDNLSSHFPAIAGSVWLGDDMKLRRNIRNAIAHKGGTSPDSIFRPLRSR